MKSKYHPYFWFGIHTFLLILLATAFSFYVGMDEFRVACNSIQGIYEPYGNGIVRFSYAMCEQNIFVFESMTFFLLACISVFMTHVEFNAFVPGKFKKKIILLGIVSVVFFLQSVLLHSFFSQIRSGFLEHWTSLNPPGVANMDPGFQFYISGFFIGLIGPILMNLFAKRYHFKLFESHRVTKYLYHLIGSIILQIISMFLLSILVAAFTISTSKPTVIEKPQQVEYQERTIQIPTLAPKTIHLPAD